MTRPDVLNKLVVLRTAEEAMTPGPWKCDDSEPQDVVLWGPDRVTHPDGHFLANVDANALGHEQRPAPQVAFDLDAANGHGMEVLRNHAKALIAVATAAADVAPCLIGQFGRRCPGCVLCRIHAALKELAAT